MSGKEPAKQTPVAQRRDNIGSIEISPERLIEVAQGVRTNAYAPYSHYPVSAAVLGNDGRIYTGVNVENAVYPLTQCAEQVAIFKAVAAGVRTILSIAVVTQNAGSPCGACRQVMREFGGPELAVYIADPSGVYRTRTLAQLLPDSFSAADLGEPDAT